MIPPLSPVVVLERLQARASRSSRFAAGPTPAPVAKVWQAERPSFGELSLAGMTIGKALQGVR